MRSEKYTNVSGSCLIDDIPHAKHLIGLLMEIPA